MKVYHRGDDEAELTVVGSLHGDEPAGKRAIERVLDENLGFKKSVKFIVVNEEALEKDRRYLESDLNRSFPGDPESDRHEEQLAAELLDEIGDSKVLDLHTTQSHPKTFSTLKDTEEKTLEMIKAANIDKAICFPEDSGSLTEYVEGIVVETGLQKSEQAVENAVEIIKNFLAYYGAIDQEFRTSEPDIYKYQETVEGNWKFKAENFKKVKKGEVYAQRENEELRAEEGFYPVLMSTNGYEGKLGFKAKKL